MKSMISMNSHKPCPEKDFKLSRQCKCHILVWGIGGWWKTRWISSRWKTIAFLIMSSNSHYVAAHLQVMFELLSRLQWPNQWTLAGMKRRFGKPMYLYHVLEHLRFQKVPLTLVLPLPTWLNTSLLGSIVPMQCFCFLSSFVCLVEVFNERFPKQSCAETRQQGLPFVLSNLRRTFMSFWLAFLRKLYFPCNRIWSGMLMIW